VLLCAFSWLASLRVFSGKDAGKKIGGRNMKDKKDKVRKIKASGLAVGGDILLARAGYLA
jgi:hypothetical protein